MNQLNIGYSYDTSLPAYRENQSEKARQLNRIVEIVKRGSTCIRKLAKETGLPDSTVAGRVNDAIKEGLIRYEGRIEYDGRKRKMITA